MMFAPLAGMALVVMASTGPIHAPDPTATHLSAREKSGAMQTLVERATECIAGQVAKDTRYGAQLAAGTLGDLIVDSVPACLTPVRAMIDAHDRFYGDGSGEAFFMGPYLDVLPRAVARRSRAETAREGAAAGNADVTP